MIIPVILHASRCPLLLAQTLAWPRDLGLILGGSLMAAAVVLIILGQVQRSRRQSAKVIEAEEAARQQRGMRSDIEQLADEIEKLTRKFNAQVEVKATRLERLLKLADMKIARLEKLADAQEPLLTSSLPQGDLEAPGQARSKAMQGRAVDAQSESTEDRLAREVYALADQGQTPMAIARKLGEHVGKIELILALRSVA